MALPTGTFASVYAGALKVSLSAEIIKNGVSYPFNNGGDIALRAYVNTGSGIVYLPLVNRVGPAASFVLSYPGGSASWSLGVEVVGFEIGGAGTIQAKNIQLTAELYKR